MNLLHLIPFISKDSLGYYVVTTLEIMFGLKQ